MRAMNWMMGLLIVGLTVLTVQAGEEFYLVKIKGLDKQMEVQSMGATEYKALEAAVKLEQKVFPEAVAEAGKEWRADELNKKTPFAGNKLSPRSIVSAAKYSSSEKATEALTKYEDQQAKKEEREFKKKAAVKSKEQLKQEADLMSAAALVKTKLDAKVAKAAPGAPAEVKGVAAGVEAPGGAKVNAAVDKAAK